MIAYIVLSIAVVASATGLILAVREPRPRHKIAGLAATVMVLVSVVCYDRMDATYAALPPLQPPELMKALGRWPDWGICLAVAAAVISFFTAAKPRMFLLVASVVMFVWFFMAVGFWV